MENYRGKFLFSIISRGKSRIFSQILFKMPKHSRSNSKKSSKSTKARKTEEEPVNDDLKKKEEYNRACDRFKDMPNVIQGFIVVGETYDIAEMPTGVMVMNAMCPRLGSNGYVTDVVLKWIRAIIDPETGLHGFKAFFKKDMSEKDKRYYQQIALGMLFEEKMSNYVIEFILSEFVRLMSEPPKTDEEKTWNAFYLDNYPKCGRILEPIEIKLEHIHAKRGDIVLYKGVSCNVELACTVPLLKLDYVDKGEDIFPAEMETIRTYDRYDPLRYEAFSDEADKLAYSTNPKPINRAFLGLDKLDAEDESKFIRWMQFKLGANLQTKLNMKGYCIVNEKGMLEDRDDENLFLLQSRPPPTKSKFFVPHKTLQYQFTRAIRVVHKVYDMYKEMELPEPSEPAVLRNGVGFDLLSTHPFVVGAVSSLGCTPAHLLSRSWEIIDNKNRPTCPFVDNFRID